MQNPLCESLRAVEQQMQFELQRVRATLAHAGNKGSSLEKALREFLRLYLPTYTKVGHGEVLDSFGKHSTQLDVIITNEYHPPLTLEEEPSLHLIEGVACSGEVKASFRSDHLEDIIPACQKFKCLSPHFGLGVEAYSNPEDLERFVDHRPYFVFAYESDSRIESIAAKMRQTYEDLAIPIVEQIDAVFILGKGSILNFGRGTGNLKYKTVEHLGRPSQSLPGIHAISAAEEGVLSLFLGWYSLVTPRFSLRDNPVSRYLLRSPGVPNNNAGPDQ